MLNKICQNLTTPIVLEFQILGNVWCLQCKKIRAQKTFKHKRYQSFFHPVIIKFAMNLHFETGLSSCSRWIFSHGAWGNHHMDLLLVFLFSLFLFLCNLTPQPVISEVSVIAFSNSKVASFKVQLINCKLLTQGRCITFTIWMH